MKTREIKGSIIVAGTIQGITNKEIFCPQCNEWINSIMWALEVNKGEISYTCGECDYIHTNKGNHET